MGPGDLIGAGQIGKGAGDLEYPMIGAGREIEALGRLQQ